MKRLLIILSLLILSSCNQNASNLEVSLDEIFLNELNFPITFNEKEDEYLENHVYRNERIILLMLKL